MIGDEAGGWEWVWLAVLLVGRIRDMIEESEPRTPYLSGFLLCMYGVSSPAITTGQSARSRLAGFISPVHD